MFGKRKKRMKRAIIISTVIIMFIYFIIVFERSTIPLTSPPYTLQIQVENIVSGFEGDVGVYVHNYATGESVSINSDTLYPTASMIKIPIMLTLFQEIQEGRLDYHDDLIYTDSLLYPGDDIVGSFVDGENIALSKLVFLMASVSDNTASLWLQSLAGTGTNINKWLEENGFESTRVNSRTLGREDGYGKFGWGQTTPREMAHLVTLIHDRKAVSPAASDEMYRMLTHSYWSGEALSAIPPFVQVASKQGAVSESRSEVLYVNAPSGDYVFCIITNKQKDLSWDYDNDGFVLIRKISTLLWQYFEPNSSWKHAEGFEKWTR
jgi:beta-lactamase class A